MKRYALLLAITLAGCGGADDEFRATATAERVAPLPTFHVEGPTTVVPEAASWLNDAPAQAASKSGVILLSNNRVLLWNGNTVLVCEGTGCRAIANNEGASFIPRGNDQVVRVSRDLNTTLCSVSNTLSCEASTEAIALGDKILVGGPDGSYTCDIDGCSQVIKRRANALLLEENNVRVSFAVMPEPGQVSTCSVNARTGTMDCGPKTQLPLATDDSESTLIAGALGALGFAAKGPGSVLYCSIEDRVYCTRAELNSSRPFSEFRIVAKNRSATGDRIMLLSSEGPNLKKGVNHIDFVAGPLSQTGGKIAPMSCYFSGWSNDHVRPQVFCGDLFQVLGPYTDAWHTGFFWEQKIKPPPPPPCPWLGYCEAEKSKRTSVCEVGGAIAFGVGYVGGGLLTGVALGGGVYGVCQGTNGLFYLACMAKYCPNG